MPEEKGKIIDMRLLIIRHGESEADLLDVHEGRADFPLTERGQRQAAAVAEYVKIHYQINAIYCSPLKRACQTGVYLSQATGVPLIMEEKLMEFNNGLIAGLDRQIAKEMYPYVENLPVHAAVYEQESALEFRFRADYVLSKILTEFPVDSTVAVVTHGGMINQLYRSFLRLPVECDLFFSTGDTGIHEWNIIEGQRRIIRANLTAHCRGI